MGIITAKAPNQKIIEKIESEAKKCFYKTLFYVAFIAAGIAMTILLGHILFPIGIGIILVSSFGLYQNIRHYQESRFYLTNSLKAIQKSLQTRRAL